jgi:hypothetical protein
MTDSVPANQIVEVDSVWDLGDTSDDNIPRLFEVKRISNGAAFNTEDEEDDNAISIDIDDLAKNYLKLTPEEVKRIRNEEREFHKSTIQPLKGPNGKIIQVGSTWDIKEPEDEFGHPFTVGSLSPASKDYEGVIWQGPYHSGFGKSPSEIYKYGTEIPLDKLSEYYSEYNEKQLESEIKKYINKGENVVVEREFNDGKLQDYGIIHTGSNGNPPSVKCEDIELSPEKKAEIERQHKEFLDWVAAERALAAEGSEKLNVLKRAKLSVPLIKKSEGTRHKAPVLRELIPLEKEPQKKLDAERLKA